MFQSLKPVMSITFAQLQNMHSVVGLSLRSEPTCSLGAAGMTLKDSTWLADLFPFVCTGILQARHHPRQPSAVSIVTSAATMAGSNGRIATNQEGCQAADACTACEVCSL